MLIGARRTLLRSPAVVAEEGSSYTPQGVRFDGSTDNLLEADGVSGAPSATKSALISFWIKMTGGDGAAQIIYDVAGGNFISRASDNKLRILYGGVIDVKTAATYTNGMGWVHFLASFDVAASVCHIYVEDASDMGSPTLINANIDFSTLCVFGCNSGGTERLNAEIADFYFNPGTYLDLSNSTNRRKFIDGSGNPVDLGSDGSTPTGSAPLVFLSGATATWHQNKGSGDGFTSAATLTDAANNPP
jgi:hypothetical protein